MKNLFLLLLACAISGAHNAQTISPLLLGQAYHYTEWKDYANDAAVKKFPYPAEVKASGARLIRIGGKQYNRDKDRLHIPRNDDGDIIPVGYVKIIDDIRSNCSTCEPVLTIPFDYQDPHPDGLTFQQQLDLAVTNAKDMISVINIVHKRHVKYIIIANEPGEEYDFKTATNAPEIAAYTKALAMAVKEVDPEIKTIGPEHEQYLGDAIGSGSTALYNVLFSGNNDNNDISGLIQSGTAKDLPYIDYISVHQYVYSTPASMTLDNIKTQLELIRKTNTDSYRRYRGVLRDLREKCNDPDILANRADKPLQYMITEANQSLYMDENLDESAALTEQDARSFIGGQQWARMLALAAEYECAGLMFWSVKEGNNTPSSTTDGQLKNNRGYLQGGVSSAVLRPSYFHYQAFAKYFKGEYLKDEVLNTALTTNSSNSILGSGTDEFHTADVNDFNTLAFAAKGENITVMIINYGADEVPFTLRLDNTSYTTAKKKFQFDADVPVQKDYTVSAYSTKLLIFTCLGELRKELEYNRNAPSAGFQVVNGNNLSITDITNDPITSTDVNNCLSSGNSSTITLQGAGGATFAWYKLPSTIPFKTGSDNFASGLTPGAYLTEITEGKVCGTGNKVTVLNVVHHNSPLVDAGEDRTLCTGNTAILGNPDLPGANADYTWTSTGTAPGNDKDPSTGTLTSSASYTMTNTTGCGLSDEVTVTLGITGTDLFIRDSPHDIGNEENTETDNATGGVFWNSNDIWLRQTNDGFTHQTTSEIEYKIEQPVYIYVRVKNRGCSNVMDAQLKVYWAKGSTGLSWPTEWGGAPPYTYTATECGNLVLMGAYLSNKTVTIEAGGEQIYEFEWYPPSPELYCVDKFHYCLLARIETASTSPYGMASTEIDNVLTNTKANNNIAWKNVTINNFNTGDIPTDDDCDNLLVRNVKSTASIIDLAFKVPVEDTAESQLTNGAVNIDLGPELYAKWVAGGRVGSGVEEMTGACHLGVAGICLHPHLLKTGQAMVNKPYGLRVTGPNAYIGNIALTPAETLPICVGFAYSAQPASSTKREFHYDIIQYTMVDSVKVLTGGERYIIRRPDCILPDAGSNVTIGRGCSTTLTASPIITGAKYNWYNNETGVLEDTGAVIQVKPLFSTTYELEMLSPNGCIDYDTVRVIVNTTSMCPIRDYALECPAPGVSPKELSGLLANPTSLSNDTAWINGTLIIPSYASLTLDNMLVMVGTSNEPPTIEVNPGGSLRITNSVLTSCSGEAWGGITVVGDNSDPNQLYIESTQILNAVNPVKTDHVTGEQILNNIFLGDSTAIALKHNKGFIISGNYFEGFETDISTNLTLPNTGSMIEENHFVGAKTTVYLFNDNHASLQIKCNTFDNYGNYAIYSNNTVLGDQGSVLEGAGNSFISTSTLVNSELYHNGMPMVYYYDPANPVTLTTAGGFTAVAVPGGENPCDTVISARVAKPQVNKPKSSINDGYMLYPNPNTGSFTLAYELAKDETGSMVIYDMTGRKVAEHNLSKENTSLTINENLEEGIYLYKVVVNGKAVKTDKLVIIK